VGRCGPYCLLLFTPLDLCVSSLRRGHANLLCIVPSLTDDPRREYTLPVCLRLSEDHGRLPPVQLGRAAEALDHLGAAGGALFKCVYYLYVFIVYTVCLLCLLYCSLLFVSLFVFRARREERASLRQGAAALLALCRSAGQGDARCRRTNSIILKLVLCYLCFCRRTNSIMQQDLPPSRAPRELGRSTGF